MTTSKGAAASFFFRKKAEVERSGYFSLLTKFALTLELAPRFILSGR